MHVKNSSNHCLCFVRPFDDIDLTDEAAFRYIDINDDGSVDNDAQTMLKKLYSEKIKKKLNRKRIYENVIPWQCGGLSIYCEEHVDYLKVLCKNFVDEIKQMIILGMNNTNCSVTNATDALLYEVAHHERYISQRIQWFQGREDVLKQAKESITDAEKRKPIVIHGEPGYGKSYIMAKLAHSMPDTLNKECVVVVRFLSTSPNSCLITDVLVSICLQICEAFDLRDFDGGVSDNFNHMCNYFEALLKDVSSRLYGNHLVVILDGVNKLSSNDPSHDLKWLPRVLPPCVHVIISTTPNDCDILTTLLDVFPPECFIRVDDVQLAKQASIDIFTALKENTNRTLTPNQENQLLGAFSYCTQPLYVRVLFDIVKSWKSYENMENFQITETLHKMIISLFDRMENCHGEVMTAKALSYMCCAR